MPSGVGILHALIEPVFPFHDGSGGALAAGAFDLLPRHEQRHAKQRENNHSGDAEPAIAPSIEKFLAGNGCNHARRCFR